MSQNHRIGALVGHASPAMPSFDDRHLIFLISQPRSGSTLLQAMLSAHPLIATTSEPWVSLIPADLLRPIGLDLPYDSQIARQALREFLKESGVSDDFYREHAAQFLLGLYEQAVSHKQKTYFLDKTPRYYTIIPELMSFFPRAKFIFLVRNPLAVLNSILDRWVQGNLSQLGKHRDDLVLAPAKMLEGFRRAPERSIQVRYEDLVENPKEALRSLCHFLGVEYSDSLIRYGREEVYAWKYGDNSEFFRSGRVGSERKDAWENEFNTVQKKHFGRSYLEALGPELVRELGYDYDEMKKITEFSGEAGSLGCASWEKIMVADNITVERNALRFQRQALLQEISLMQKSLSWKMTAPFRWAKRVFQGNHRG